MASPRRLSAGRCRKACTPFCAGREIAAAVIQEAGGDFNLTELLRELEDEMEQASANLEFERAALLRDQIMEVKSGTGLTKIEPKRKPVKYSRNNGRRRSRV